MFEICFLLFSGVIPRDDRACKYQIHHVMVGCPQMISGVCRSIYALYSIWFPSNHSTGTKRTAREEFILTSTVGGPVEDKSIRFTNKWNIVS
jgi:hypothetical protein